MIKMTHMVLIVAGLLAWLAVASSEAYAMMPCPRGFVHDKLDRCVKPPVVKPKPCPTKNLGHPEQ
jgi:hypothetical protein